MRPDLSRDSDILEDALSDADPDSPLDASDMAGDMGMTSCTSDALPQTLATQPDPTSVALAGGSEGFVVAYQGVESFIPRIFWRFAPLEGEVGEAQMTMSESGRGEAPAVLATSEGFLLAWHDNVGDGYRIATRPLDPEGAPLAGPASVSDRGVATPERHDTAALGFLGEAPLAAFVLDTIELRTFALLPLTTRGAATDAPYNTDLVSLGAPSIARGEDDAWLAFLSPVGGRTAALARIHDDLTLDPPVRIDASGDLVGDVAIASGPDHELGAVYTTRVGGVRNELRFRALHADGNLNGGEQNLSELDRGQDASITAFTGGFAVAYRRSGEEATEIELVLVSRAGEVATRRTIAESSVAGGRVQVATTTDGSIALAWWEEQGEGGEASARLQFQRVFCGGS